MHDTKTPNRTGKRTANTTALLGRLWGDYLHHYWPRLALALLAMGVLALTMSAIPFIIEAIFAAFNLQGPASPQISDQNSVGAHSIRLTLDQLIQFGPLILAALGALYALSQYTQSRLTLGASLDTLRDIQNHLFARFLNLDFAGQRREMSGAVASLFTNDIQILREMLTRTTNGVRDLLQLVGLCAVMLFTDITLFIAVIGVYAAIGWPIAWLGKKLRTSARAAQAETGTLAAHITQSVKGAAMIKTYALETREQSRAGEHFEKRTVLLKRAAFLRAFNEPFTFFVGTIALGVVVTIMGLRVQAGVLDGPSISRFVVALLLLSQPARGLSTLYAVLQEGLAAFSRILNIIDTQPLIKDKEDAKTLSFERADIEIDHISFSYGERGPAINDLSLSLEAGSSTALVGESGAGKSTLMHLLTRLYDLEAGRIAINDIDIRDMTLASLRSHIAVVSQDTVLFNESLYNNISYGRIDASRDDVIQAAKAANIHDFIEKLPNGYDTLAGENGDLLSGGQRQRIGIARAFLKNAPILLLDEPTSALDAESESAIHDALEKLQKERTTIIIAHRLFTIQHADKICVLEDGRLIESGSHETLMRANGQYAKLARIQFGATP